MRRCCSASLGSGTARKRASAADSAAGSRKPKIDGVGLEDAGESPPAVIGEAENSRTEERSAAERSFIMEELKASKVAQSPAGLRNIRLIFAIITNLTKFTTWCYNG